ncbi:hypothetical protein EFA46_002955 [Halarchaeum sp. CBA1220]|uniref:DUF7096 domain-containing protein n=1 Tax=Halarchaeum sp. CBA1220 TaxID=1853682 RepID=UPI000F3A92D6|nr:hypothetical protein [Halarchaeum sp. CBA1220]QLC33209.1 hypothetical protein EFA46_002955 [Halarchaeum sp. CBA1220]
MSRLPVLFAALLLLAAPVAAFGGATDAAPLTGSAEAATATPATNTATANTTNVLRLGDPNAAGFTTTGPTVTVTVGAASASFDGRYATYGFESRWAAASTDAERLAVIRNATDAAANRTAAIAADEAAAREAYVDGDLSAPALVHRVALDSARADALATYIATLREHAGELSEENATVVRDRLTALRGELAAYGVGTGESLHAELGDAIAGERAPMRVYVAASPSGLTLAALDDDTYYHTTYRVDNYDAVPASNVDLGAFLDSLERLYPTTTNLSSSNGGFRSFSAPADAHLYRAVLGYNRGADAQSTLVVYFDPSTDSVYREDKRLATADIVTGAAVTRTQGSVTLAVNRTYAGGPLRVAVYNDAGDPLDATVRVNGTTAGTTDPDTGVVWALAPAGEYNVTAEHDGTTVTLDTGAASA